MKIRPRNPEKIGAEKTSQICLNLVPFGTDPFGYSPEQSRILAAQAP